MTAMKKTALLCLLLSCAVAMQYVELLRPCSVTYESIPSFVVSNASFYDDSPHDLLELPV